MADTVIQMDRYVPLEITEAARVAIEAGGTGQAAAAAGHGANGAGQTGKGDGHGANDGGQAGSVYRAADFRLPSGKRIPAKNNALLREGRVKIKVLSDDSFLISRDQLDLRGLEQLADREQVASLAHILKYAQLHLIDGRQSFDEVLDRIEALIAAGGLEKLFDVSTVRCGLAQVRRAEIAGMLNRYRKL